MADSAAPASGTKPSSSVKLVLLGEAAVGKSSLVLRFVNDEFQENKEPTIGAAFLTQKCPLPHRLIKFEIWDTAGQERFASLAPMYYRNAQSALVVYDLTKPTSLLKAKHWVAELQRQASPGIVIALVGNKLDLCDEEGSGPPATPTPSRRTPTIDNNDAGADADADADAEHPTTTAPEPTEEPEDDLSGDRRKISTAEARLYAEEEGLLFYETSAKTGFAVQDVFTAIAGAIPESSMKGARGSGAAAGAGGTFGARGDAEGANRVNLNGSRGGEAAKDGCAC